MQDELAGEWLRSVGRAEVASAMEAIYARCAAAIATRGPACWASGRCCNFEKAGHRLYVTGLEAAYTVAGLRGLAGLTGEGATDGGFAQATVEGRNLRVASANVGGACPFQVSNLCGVHGIKPLGCRVYFCDRSAQAWQQELSEALLGEIKALHDRFGIEYRYGEWLEMLGRFGKMAT